MSQQLSQLRTLTYVFDEGITLKDGSVMTVHKCVIEIEGTTAYVMFFDFTGELFFQREFSPLFVSTISELCGTLNVPVTVMDLCK